MSTEEHNTDNKMVPEFQAMGKQSEQEHNVAVPDQIGTLQIPSNIFFEPVKIEPDTHRSPLCGPAQVLMSQGVQGENLRISLLVILAMVSEKLGYSLALMLVDAIKTKAQALLSVAKHLVPPAAIVSLEFPVKDIDSAAKEVYGKTIINEDYAELRRSKKLLKSLAEQRHSVVTITVDSKNSDWKDSTLIRTYLSSDSGADFSASEIIRHVDFQVEASKTSKFLERLTAPKVEIPFREYILTAMKGQNVESPEGVVKILEGLIPITAIIGRPDPVTEAEIIASLYGIDKSHLIEWRRSKGLEQELPIPTEGQTITATKIDYYLAYQLLGGRLDVGSKGLSLRQQRIFEALKDMNIGRAGATFTDATTDIEKQAAITRNPDAWIEAEDIFVEVKKGVGDPIKFATFKSELKTLGDKGIVKHQKSEKSKSVGYYITAMEVGQSITLPHPSSIIDPVYNGEKVKVVNPINGQIEEI